MKINFTQKEFKALMDLLSVSEWVLHAHHSVDRDDTIKYRQLIQKLSAHAAEMGMEDLIQQNEQTGEYLPTQKYEEQGAYMGYIEEFEEHSFWQNLAFKLAIRDLIEQEGEQNVEKMDIADRGSKIMQLEDWYHEEFNNNGLANLRVKSNPAKKVN